MNYARQYPKFWLGYFVFSVILLAGNAAASLGNVLEPGGPGRLLGVLFGLVGLWPLYGFIRQRGFNPRWLWQALFGLALFATVAAVAICLFTAFAAVAALPVFAAAAFVLVGGPYLFALHQYIYRSPDLWA
jgi:hypothetical protein